MLPLPLALGLPTLEQGGIAAFLLDVSRRVEECAFVCKIRDRGPLKIQNYSLISIIIIILHSRFFRHMLHKKGGLGKQANCFKED